MNAAHHLPDTYGPVVVYAGLLCTFQVSIAAVFHPPQSWLVVVETNGSDGAGGVAGLAGLGARRVLTEQTTACFFIDVYVSFHNILFLWLVFSSI
jgi:hypothetical protein